MGRALFPGSGLVELAGTAAGLLSQAQAGSPLLAAASIAAPCVLTTEPASLLLCSVDTRWSPAAAGCAGACSASLCAPSAPALAHWLRGRVPASAAMSHKRAR